MLPCLLRSWRGLSDLCINARCDSVRAIRSDGDGPHPLLRAVLFGAVEALVRRRSTDGITALAATYAGRFAVGSCEHRF